MRKAYLARLKTGLSLDEDHRNPENPTFLEMAELYLKSLKRKYSTIETYEQLINCYWLPHLHDTHMLHMNYRHILSADAEIKWPSARKRKDAMIPLRGIFNLAMATLDDFNTNFAAKLPKEGYETKDIDPFTEDEKQAILSALEVLNQDACDYFTLGFELGCRLPGELNALEWDSVTKTYAHIHQAIARRRLGATKTHSDRKVILTPDAIAVFDRRVRPIKGGFIFTNSHGGPHLDGDVMNGWWKKALIKAGVPYKRAYNCRHTRATLDLMAGGKPAFLAKQLGHTLAQFWKTYATWIDSEEDAAEMENILAGRAAMKARKESEK